MVDKSKALIPVTSGSLIFPELRKHGMFRAGSTIAEIVDDTLPKRFWPNAHVMLDDDPNPIPLEWWMHIKPLPGHRVTIAIAPSAETLRMAIPLVTTLAGAAIGIAAGVPSAAVSLIAGAGSIFGAWAATTFIPLPEVDLPEQSYAVTAARNQLRPYDPIPRVFGKVRHYPPLLAKPYTEFVGNDQYLNLLVCLGYAPIRATDFRIGETPTDEFGDITIATRTHYQGDFENLTWPTDVDEEVADSVLSHAPVWETVDDDSSSETFGETILADNIVSRVTQLETIKIGIDLAFPRGLWERDSDDLRGRRVDVQIRYRLLGQTDELPGDSWHYHIPGWSLDDEVSTFTDEWWFKGLVILNNALDVLNRTLSSIGMSQRIVSWQLFDHLGLTIQGTRVAVQGQIAEYEAYQTGAGPHSPWAVREVNELQRTDSLLAETAQELASSADRISEWTGTISAWNGRLSKALWIANGIDGFIRTGMYIDRGYGPPLHQQQPLQQLLHWIRGDTEIFAEPEDGAFVIHTDERYQGVLRKAVNIDGLTAGQYEVQVRRVTPDSDPDDTNISDTLHFYAFRSYRDRPPVSEDMKKKLAIIRLRIKATAQLNNSVESFNCICESPLPWHDGTSWQNEIVQESGDKGRGLIGGIIDLPSISSKAVARTTENINISRNPAWIMAEILRGAAAKEPVGDNNLDIPRLIEFSDHCNDMDARSVNSAGNRQIRGLKSTRHPWYFDAVLDNNATLQRALRDVCRVAKASPTIRDGKFSVIMDRVQTTPMGAINPRNSSSLVASKTVGKRAHALRMRYQNAAEGYQFAERMVYDDGYGEECDYTYGDTEPEVVNDVDLFGVTSQEQALRFGRYLLACAELRPESFQVNMDWEHLVFERGDLIDFQYDVVLWGLGAGRIESFNVDGSGHITDLVLDELVTMEAGTTYQMKIRTIENFMLIGTLVTSAGSGFEVEFETAVDPGAYTVAVGSMVWWGEEDLVNIDCIVKSIRPGPRDMARVTLIEAAPAVHDAEETIVDYDARLTVRPDPAINTPPRPQIVGLSSDLNAATTSSDGVKEGRISLNLRFPPGTTDAENEAARDLAGVQVQYRRTPAGTAVRAGLGAAREERVDWETMPMFNRDLHHVYAAPVVDRRYYDIRVRSVTRAGVPSGWVAEWMYRVLGKDLPPASVYDVKWDTIKQLLTWQHNPPPDHAGYKVRHIAGNGGSWEGATPAHDGILAEAAFQTKVYQEGSHILFIKAVDKAGNESSRAANAGRVLGESPFGFSLWEALDLLTGFGAGFVTLSNMEYTSGVPGYASIANAPGADTAPFYRGAEGGLPFYRDDGSKTFDEPFYHTDYPESFAEYESWTDEWNLLALGNAYRRFVAQVDSGKDWRLEWRDDHARLWPWAFGATCIDDMLGAENMWPDSMNQDFWPADMDWQPVSGPLNPTNPIYEFGITDGLIEKLGCRIIAPAGNDRLEISKWFDAFETPRIEEVHTEFTVANTGVVNLDVDGYFTNFVGVLATIHEDGCTGTGPHYIEINTLNNPAVSWTGPNIGPDVEIKDVTDARVTGVIDYTLIGYNVDKEEPLK